MLRVGRGLQTSEVSTLLQAYADFYLSLERCRQPPFGCCANYFSGFFNNLMVPLVSIAAPDKLVYGYFHTCVGICTCLTCLPFNMEAFVVFNLPHLRTILF